MRTRRGRFPRAIWFAAAAVLLVAAALAGWFALDPGPLARIVVIFESDGKQSARWEPSYWRIAIDNRNRYTYATTHAEQHGSIAFAPYEQRFRAIPEIRWSMPPRGAYPPGVYFWAEGSRRTVAPSVFGDAPHHRALRDFAATLHDAVIADVRRVNAPRITSLNTLDGLQSVVLNGRGAMCGSCIWDVSFAADGRARATTYHWRGGMRGRSHDGTVQWNAVTAALRETRWGELDPHYDTNASDVVGVRFTFVFPGRSYTIEAPDLASAPPALLRPFACVMLLAATTEWSPSVEPHGLPEVRSMRLMADQPGLYAAMYDLRSNGHATPAPRLGACRR